MTTGDRKSTTDHGDDFDEILHESEAVVRQEAINGLLQFDEVVRLAATFIPDLRFNATPEMVLDLNRIIIGINMETIRQTHFTFRRILCGV